MTFMSFVCDYALIDPVTLAYKVDCVDRGNIFATYEDIDEDCFRLNVFPQDEVIPNLTVLAVGNAVRDYLFDE